MESLRKQLEKALYFYVEHCWKEELEEHYKWYKVDNIEDLVDIMFESYLDNYSKKELVYRINDLFVINNVSDYGRLIAFRNFLEKDNNYDLFELESQNKNNLNKGCVVFLKDKKHLLKVFEGECNGSEDSIMDYQTFINNYSFRVVIL